MYRKPNHYSPRLGRLIVCALYHEARRRKVAMTQLADTLLTDALANTPTWEAANQQLAETNP